MGTNEYESIKCVRHLYVALEINFWRKARWKIALTWLVTLTKGKNRTQKNSQIENDICPEWNWIWLFEYRKWNKIQRLKWVKQSGRKILKTHKKKRGKHKSTSEKRNNFFFHLLCSGLKRLENVYRWKWKIKSNYDGSSEWQLPHLCAVRCKCVCECGGRAIANWLSRRVDGANRLQSQNGRFFHISAAATTASWVKWHK